MLSKVRKRLRRALLGPPQVVPRRGVDLFYWRPKDGRRNFGDHLSSAIVVKAASTRNFFLDEDVPTPRRLLAIGSILQYARDGDVIWGSGVNGSVPVERHTFQALDVRAVRGPLTAEFLARRGIATPEVYGDPALLTERLLGARFPLAGKRAPVAFVPNFQDLERMAGWENVISPYLPWARVIEAIVGAELVISSSLHGLIVADAFGIPCTYLRLSEAEDMFKYEDYALGAGRGGISAAHSREDAIRASPLAPPNPDLDRLFASFPWDLWV